MADPASTVSTKTAALGDTVLAISEDGKSCPALVVEVNADGSVKLHRFTGGGISPQANAVLAPGAGPAAAGQYTAKP